MEAKLIKYTLSDDRHEMITEFETDKGIMESRVVWSFAADDEWVQHCLNLIQRGVSSSNMVVGETTKGRKIGPLCVFTDHGPPIWWFPHVKVFKWGFGAGWYKSCFELSCGGFGKQS